MAPHVKADLDTNPTAGLLSIMSTKSWAAWVEINITGDGVDQRHNRPKFVETATGVSDSRRDANDRDAFALQQATCGGDEFRAVIDD